MPVKREKYYEKKIIINQPDINSLKKRNIKNVRAINVNIFLEKIKRYENKQ